VSVFLLLLLSKSHGLVLDLTESIDYLTEIEEKKSSNSDFH